MPANYLLILAFIFSFNNPDSPVNCCETGIEVLEQSKKQYDPEGKWNTTVLNFHIQEPRTMNPSRYSVLSLNNSTGYFELQREIEEGIAVRIVDEDGNPQILLNGESSIPEDIREANRLDESRNKGYRDFYRMINGLPMSLNEDVWVSIPEPEDIEYEGQEAYKVNVELKEPLISKYWSVIISKSDYSMLALELNHPDEPESDTEMIVFDGAFSWDGITIPRFRHWYNKTTGEYLGSDLIVRELRSGMN